MLGQFAAAVHMDDMLFDHERLAVYERSLEFLVVAASLGMTAIPSGCSFLADQLRRAASSIPFNVAEGAGEFRPKEKARFYRMARRSATECASILDALRMWPRLDEAAHETETRERTLTQGRDLLLEIVSMLIKMAQRFDNPEHHAHR